MCLLLPLVDCPLAPAMKRRRGLGVRPSGCRPRVPAGGRAWEPSRVSLPSHAPTLPRSRRLPRH